LRKLQKLSERIALAETRESALFGSKKAQQHVFAPGSKPDTTHMPPPAATPISAEQRGSQSNSRFHDPMQAMSYATDEFEAEEDEEHEEEFILDRYFNLLTEAQQEHALSLLDNVPALTRYIQQCLLRPG